MKATLATLACLLTVGFLSAASVEGNNTAVVIRKEVVKSDTGFQFLCVPVDGLSIDGAPTGKIKLSTLLPVATLPNGTYAMDLAGYKSFARDGAWTDDWDLDGGTPFWVKYGEGESTEEEEDDELILSAVRTATPIAPIVFCGQDRVRQAPNWKDLIAGNTVVLKNDSSVAITLDDAAKLATGEVRSKDQILTIQDGSSEYKIYTYNVTQKKWKTGKGVAQAVTGAIIAPGEAFYYYKAAATTNN